MLIQCCEEEGKEYTLLKGTKVNGDKLEIKYEDLLQLPSVGLETYKIENGVTSSFYFTNNGDA